AEELLYADVREKLEPLSEACQSSRRVVRRQNLGGHRLERANERRTVLGARRRLESTQNLLMAQVQAVEGADRDRAALFGAIVSLQRGERAIQAHSRPRSLQRSGRRVVHGYSVSSRG